MSHLKHLMRATLVLSLWSLVSTGIARAEPATLPTPEAAVAALVAALEAHDKDALRTLFGPESDDLITSGDAAEDAEARDAFLRDHAAFSRLVPDGDGRMELQVGRTRWPFPVTLIGVGGGWQFDAAAARDEILSRRIGRNELEVIDLMRRAAAVQRDFRSIDHDGDGVMEFAAAILSDPGARNGLYWPPEDGTPDSPIGVFLAQAAADGLVVDGVESEPQPYHGYYYRILTAQGAAAPGGALDYMVNGNMLAGHALLAYPAAHGDTGIMSFMVGENGVVMQADLGDATLAAAGAITRFDPGPDWAVVTD